MCYASESEYVDEINSVEKMTECWSWNWWLGDYQVWFKDMVKWQHLMRMGMGVWSESDHPVFPPGWKWPEDEDEITNLKILWESQSRVSEY